MAWRFKNKQINVTSDFDINTNKLINVVNPLDNQDAATKIYVDTAISDSGSTTTWYLRDSLDTQALVSNDKYLKFAQSTTIDSIFGNSTVGTTGDPYTILLSVRSNSISATQINVSGNGSNGQLLSANGSGGFNWINNNDISLSTELSEEISTRTSADTSLSTALSYSNQSLETTLSSEINIRGSADSSLSTELSGETSSRTSGDLSLATELDNYSTTLEGLTDTSIDTPVEGNLLVYNSNSSKWINTNTISGDTTIIGDLYVSGTTTTINTTDMNVADNIILINSGETGGGVSLIYAGIEVDRGSLDNYRFVLDDTITTNPLFKVGALGDYQAVATRQDNPTSSGVTYWNEELSRFDTSTSLIFDSDTLKYGSTITLNNDVDIVHKKYVDDQITGVTSLTTSLSTELSTEISTTDSEIISLSTELSTEISTTGSEITSLDTILGEEVSSRISADTSLESLTVYVGTSLDTVLSIEIDTRGTADTSLATEIDDIFTSVDEIQYSTGFTYTGNTEGHTWWNTEENTLNINTGLGSTIQAGQELQIKVYNNTNEVIPDGKAVYPNGTFNDYPTIGLAKTNTYQNVNVDYGLTTTEIPIGGYGFVVWFGKARGLDTSMYATGATLWISATDAGEMTDVKPNFPNYAIQIGIVFKSDPTDGIIFITSRSTPEDTFNNFWNGTFRETFDFRVSVTGTTVLGALIPANGNDDMTMLFNDGMSLLNTSPSGITIELTPGTIDTLTENYVHMPFSTKQLTVSTSDWPTEQHIKVAKITLLDSGSTASNGAIGNQNWNDHIQSALNEMGHLSHITEWIRQRPPEWDSGTEGTVTVNTGPTPDDVLVSVTGGVLFQLHKQPFPVFNTGDTMYVINNPTVAYQPITNLNTQLEDSEGGSLDNKSFSFVLWGVGNKAGESSQLMINLPSGSYAFTSPDTAVSDGLNYSNYTIPREFKSIGFLIARFTMTYKNDAWVIIETEDLRGRLPNSSAGGGSAGGGGVTSYLGLTDTPNVFTGSELMATRVNSAGTAQEFTSVLNLDIIDEYTATSGVTIDSVLNKDGRVFNNDSTAPTTDEELSNKKYIDDQIASAPTSLSGLTDTTINGLTEGDILIYSGGTWVNDTTTDMESVFLQLTGGTITGSVVIEDNLTVYDYYYMGDENTDGSWRWFINLDGDLEFQKRISTVWTYKSKMT